MTAQLHVLTLQHWPNMQKPPTGSVASTSWTCNLIHSRNVLNVYEGTCLATVCCLLLPTAFFSLSWRATRMPGPSSLRSTPSRFLVTRRWSRSPWTSPPSMRSSATTSVYLPNWDAYEIGLHKTYNPNVVRHIETFELDNVYVCVYMAKQSLSPLQIAGIRIWKHSSSMWTWFSITVRSSTKIILISAGPDTTWGSSSRDGGLSY